MKLSLNSLCFEFCFFPEYLISDTYNTLNIRKIAPDDKDMRAYASLFSHT